MTFRGYLELVDGSLQIFEFGIHLFHLYRLHSLGRLGCGKSDGFRASLQLSPQSFEIVIHATTALQCGELTLKIRSSQLSRGLTGGLEGLDLFLHPLEGRHGRIGADVADGTLQLLLGSAAWALALSMSFLVLAQRLSFEGNQTLLSDSTRRSARTPPSARLLSPGTSCGGSFPSQGFLTLLQRQLSTLIPGLGLSLQLHLAGRRF